MENQAIETNQSLPADMYVLPVWYATRWYGELGLYRIGQNAGVLQWSPAQKYVRLIDRYTDDTIFDSRTSTITNADVQMNEIKIKDTNKWHIMFIRNTALERAYFATLLIGDHKLNGGVSVAGGSLIMSLSHIDTLEKILRDDNGVTLRKVRYGRSIAIGLAIGAVLMALLIWYILHLFSYAASPS